MTTVHTAERYIQMSRVVLAVLRTKTIYGDRKIAVNSPAVSNTLPAKLRSQHVVGRP